jgi:predicted nucleotidyltransferase
MDILNSEVNPVLRQNVSVEELRALYLVRDEVRKVLGGRSFRMVLFGSKARGDWDENSDIDIALIVDGMDRQLKNRLIDLVADVELEHLVPLSVLFFSTEEFERLRARERRIALDIEMEGIPIDS